MQGRKEFQSSKVDFIALDEECPLDIFLECIARLFDTSGTGTCSGRLILTFTPLSGLTELIVRLRDLEQTAPKDYIQFFKISMYDVPHLSLKEIEQILSLYPEHERMARAHGEPFAGAGQVLPISESSLLCKPFEIPEHFSVCWACDVGLTRTVIVFLAIDPNSDICYLYQEMVCENMKHLDIALKLRNCGLIPGVIDTTAKIAGPDQVSMFSTFERFGLDIMIPQKKDKQYSIQLLWERCNSGRFKVFDSCREWRNEYRLWHKNDKGDIVKTPTIRNDLMDATLYGIRSGLENARPKSYTKYRNLTEIEDHMYGNLTDDMVPDNIKSTYGGI